jgi:drug/metabolite transporter (DMT)-like permease
MNLVSPSRPRPWAIPLAFTLLYLSWGTTFLAIRVGVDYFPPALFGGTRVGLAGGILLLYLKSRGESLRLGLGEFCWTALLGGIFFIGGNWMINLGERHVASGEAAILVATTPLWTALLESVWPAGERLTLRGWLGLVLGLLGVVVLKLDQPFGSRADRGAILVVGSAMAWAVGSFLLRRHRQRTAHLVSAAYQMLLGGGGLTLIGLALGEFHDLTAERFTVPGVYAFLHLLFIGSLVGFVSYNWLLGHVTTLQASTYAYVNPMVALLVGALFGDQVITLAIFGGMVVILTGVALVRTGVAR